MKHLLSIIILGLTLQTNAQYWKQIGPGFKTAEDVKMAIDEKNNTIYCAGYFWGYPESIFNYKSLIMFKGDSMTNMVTQRKDTAGVRGVVMYKDTLFVSGGFTHILDSAVHSRNLLKYYNGKVYPIDLIQKNDSRKYFDVFHQLGDTLYMGGSSKLLAGDTINGLLKYYNGKFSSVGGGVLNKNGSPRVYEIGSYKNSLMAGGNFYSKITENFSSRNLQYFNHTRWDTIPSWGIKGLWGDVYALQEYQGDLYVGGAFRAVEPYLGIANHITRYDGEHFYSLGNGFNQSVFEMMVVGHELLIAGAFKHIELDAETKDTMHVTGLVRWNGKQFCHVSNHKFNIDYGNIKQLGFLNDTLIISGSFSKVDNDSVVGIAKWVGDYRNFPGQCTQEVKQKIVDANLSVGEIISETVASRVYPNPVGDELTVELLKGTHAKYKLFALGGAVVKEGKIDSRLRGNDGEKDWNDGRNRIDMSALEPGTYVIQLVTEESITIHKIMKE